MSPKKHYRVKRLQPFAGARRKAAQHSELLVALRISGKGYVKTHTSKNKFAVFICSIKCKQQSILLRKTKKLEVSLQVKNLHYIHRDWTGDCRLRRVDQLQRYMVCLRTYASIISLKSVDRLLALCRSQKEGRKTLRTSS